MKTKVFTSGVFALIVAFMCSMSINAVAQKNYIHDTKEENGKVVSKVIFLQDGDLLNKELRYKFKYNDEGQVIEKKACRWNSAREDWEPLFLITYTYDGDGVINSHYGMWDKKKKDYSLNAQIMEIPVESYETIFS